MELAKPLLAKPMELTDPRASKTDGAKPMELFELTDPKCYQVLRKSITNPSVTTQGPPRLSQASVSAELAPSHGAMRARDTFETLGIQGGAKEMRRDERRPPTSNASRVRPRDGQAQHVWASETGLQPHAPLFVQPRVARGEGGGLALASPLDVPEAGEGGRRKASAGLEASAEGGCGVASAAAILAICSRIER
jgi:hypothetical protein